jgi:hypothetical protein
VINEIIYQIQKNSLFNAHHLSLIDEKQTNKLNFLQRKRENDHFKLRTNKDFVFQKGISFTISNSNKNIGNINQNNESENVKNDFLRYLINFRENICIKLFGESLDNSNPKENNQINYIISNDKKTNLINMSFINKFL